MPRQWRKDRAATRAPPSGGEAAGTALPLCIEKSDEDAEGNPVPVTPAHFGVEPASRFQKTRFFNTMLDHMSKKGNGGVNACFVLRQIRKHRLDRTFPEEDIAIMLLEWLMPKVEYAKATNGAVRIGDSAPGIDSRGERCPSRDDVAPVRGRHGPSNRTQKFGST